MTSLQIPQHVVLNETVRMQCNFDLDQELLYSVKWYKDGHEFYRYVPRDAPTVQTFRVPGVNVNVSVPSETQIDSPEVPRVDRAWFSDSQFYGEIGGAEDRQLD